MKRPFIHSLNYTKNNLKNKITLIFKKNIFVHLIFYRSRKNILKIILGYRKWRPLDRQNIVTNKLAVFMAVYKTKFQKISKIKIL